MKKLVSFLSVVFSVGAFAAGVQPNQFTCEGAGNTNVIYSTSSITGAPTISVKFRGEVARNSTGIKNTTTGIGTLVQISDMHLVPLDGDEVRYNLVLPSILLSANAEPVKFETMLIQTSVANPFFRAGSASVIENNDFVSVQCTAEKVIF
jgi:hypothetical protein